MIIITHIILPVLFIMWIWAGKEKSKIDWLLKILIAGTFLSYIFLTGNWDWFSYYLRYVLIAGFLIAVCKTYRNMKGLPFFSSKSSKELFNVTLDIIVLLIFIIFNVLTLRGYYYIEEPIELSFPLKNGVYYVVHGGNSPIINYHNDYRPQKYALDIVKLNTFGARAEGFFPKELTKYSIFEDTFIIQW